MGQTEEEKLPARLGNSRPLRLYYSYSSNDQETLNQIAEYISPLRSDGLIDDWYDQRIPGGHQFAEEHRDHFLNSEIILLLISPRYLASEWCEREATMAMEQHASDDARVIPIIIAKCDWSHKPFSKLSALPRYALPIVHFEHKEEALNQIAVGLRSVVDHMRGSNCSSSTFQKSNAVSVFYSFSNKDDHILKLFRKSLVNLRREMLIVHLCDEDLLPGDEYYRVIRGHLETAELIFLLVSPDYLASNWCFGVDLPVSLERHHAGEAVVVPFLIRTTNLHKIVLASLPFPTIDGEPLVECANLDIGLSKVERVIAAIVEAAMGAELHDERVNRLSTASRTLLRNTSSMDTRARNDVRISEITDVILLIHGIRDYAMWQDAIRRSFNKSNSIKILGIKYGYYDVLRFLFPFDLSKRPQNRIAREIRNARNSYPNARISVIAHSFGTYLITEILTNEADVYLWRLIICGSVIRVEFDWGRITYKIGPHDDPEKSKYIVNECGTSDIWPILAETAGWRYGAVGTDGVRSILVQNRWHRGGHSLYFDGDFLRKYWVPFMSEGKVKEGDGVGRSQIPAWITILSWISLNWVILVLVLGASIITMTYLWQGREQIALKIRDLLIF